MPQKPLNISDKQSLLQFMQDKAYRPLSFKELTRQMQVSKEQKNIFKKLLRDLIKDGHIVKIRGERYGVPSKMNLTVGELSCHPNGFGFVAPEAGGEDIFINPRNMKGAMHRDKVVARVEGRSKGNGKREGRIIRVLERAHKTIVGRFEKNKEVGIVIPSDERVLQEIIIPLKDINTIQPVLKGFNSGIMPASRHEFIRAMEGKIVEAEITRWPAENIAPAGRIIGVIGEPDDPEVEIEVIVKKYGLPHRFLHHVIAEAKETPQEVAQQDIAGRVDLRKRTTVTIDGETAKDFDDAVSIERTNRGYKLWVSIADVAHYVKKGSVLDEEAYKRGTSVYFPDRCIPMLPEALSNGICSLNPNVDRLTLTAEIDFDHHGNILHSKFYESVINSCERLTYTKVKNILDSKLNIQDSKIDTDLLLMQELCLKLRQRRAELGSIDFDLPEPQIIIDIEGRVEDIVKSERNIAHQIIEEFMLAANQSVAAHIARLKLPFLYRIHEEPDEESMNEFKEFIQNFGYYLKGKKLSPNVLRNLLSEADGKPEEKLINHILLRSMKQARYSEKNIGHFGLAFEYYTHFTSPIRRYPDLIVHRILKTMIKTRYSEKDKAYWEKNLPEIAVHTSQRERNAMGAEREIVDLKKTQFMKDKIGEVYNGIISGVTSFGLFAELEEYFVEGLVHVTNMKDDYYIFMEKEHSLIGEHTNKRYRIGDKVKVKIENVDIERRQIDMVLEGQVKTDKRLKR
ncbi:MAG: ribonuclease R [Deltaproteobacteria bacterium]|nr:ribonuclease R [Deltaproteobacteria bacterium]